MKQKVVSKLVMIIISMGIILTIIESYNFRSYGIENSLNKALAISETVKNGLTAHMINGNMDQREVFLNSIATMSNVEDLWIIRGSHVNKQYGEPLNEEIPRDAIDKDVLKTSKLKYELYETLSKVTIRVTIPYIAERNSNINCLDCHDVNYGDTLGAISIIMDISDIKSSGINLIFLVLFFTIVAIFLVIYFASSVLKPHLETLEELSCKIKNISNGVFSNIIQKPNLSDESKNLIKEYNLLVNGLSHTFSDIDKKLNIFIGNNSHESQNPLLNSQKVITNLSEIYQFKKEVEIDSTKDEIYYRIAQILKNKFKLKTFNFIEQNFHNNSSSVVYKEGDGYFCSNDIEENPLLCRASKNTIDVCSIKGQNVCPQFKNDDKLYYCLDVNIGDYSKLIVNFIVDNQLQLDNLKKDITLIKNYIIEASPSITVKLLLEELKASAFKDGLTGLYNRKFLDEYLTKLIPQARREEINIAVLMLDMDHFKAVNDEYGHDVGDIVLKELSLILSENIRDADIVVRYGGEEFVVLLVDVLDEKAALNVANKIKTKVAKNEINIYAGNKLQKTISIGLSMYPKDSTNFDIIMKNADIALYEAKNNGRNQVVRYKEKVEVELF